jgi:hypothetical protein
MGETKEARTCKRVLEMSGFVSDRIDDIFLRVWTGEQDSVQVDVAEPEQELVGPSQVTGVPIRPSDRPVTLEFPGTQFAQSATLGAAVKNEMTQALGYACALTTHESAITFDAPTSPPTRPTNGLEVVEGCLSCQAAKVGSIDAEITGVEVCTS